MSRIPIIMPQLGESIAEATFVSIPFQVGDVIDQEGQRPASIPAWGNAPGKYDRGASGLKARSISAMPPWDGPGFQPSLFFRYEFLGRCPRLGWTAPSARRKHDFRHILLEGVPELI